MSDWDENFIINAFLQTGDKNIKYTILVTIDAYGMGINNSDIILIIQ